MAATIAENRNKVKHKILKNERRRGKSATPLLPPEE
jgi:hypothetical protein